MSLHSRREHVWKKGTEQKDAAKIEKGCATRAQKNLVVLVIQGL